MGPMTADREPLHAGELHHAHHAPARGLTAEQYVYEIGSYHYNWHTDLEVFVVVTGRIETCVAGQVSHHGSGDVVVVNANDGHATLAMQPRSRVMCLHLDSAYLASFTPSVSVPHIECRSTDATRDQAGFVRLRALLSRMMLSADRVGPGATASWESRLLDVVAALLTYFPPTAPETHVPDPAAAVDSRRALSRAVAYVDASFRERVTLEQVARHVGYSRGYLSQVFPQQVGLTFSEYLTRVRLRQATHDLRASDHLVARIASDAGFPDVKAFNTAFRRTFGRTPSSYRSILTADTQAADSVFHRRYVPRTDEEVMAVLRRWAGTVAEDDGAPCTTALRLSRPSPAQEALSLTRALEARLQEIVSDAAR